MRAGSALLVMALPLAACATMRAGEPDLQERVLGADGICNADAARQLVGQMATQALGTQALELTGARLFRWAPPDSALTLDYRQDRVTVHYDRDLRVERVACG